MMEYGIGTKVFGDWEIVREIIKWIMMCLKMGELCMRTRLPH